MTCQHTALVVLSVNDFHSSAVLSGSHYKTQNQENWNWLGHINLPFLIVKNVNTTQKSALRKFVQKKGLETRNMISDYQNAGPTYKPS